MDEETSGGGGGIRGSTQRPGDEPGDETGEGGAQTWECQLLDSSPCATHVFQHLLSHYALPPSAIKMTELFISCARMIDMSYLKSLFVFHRCTSSFIPPADSARGAFSTLRSPIVIWHADGIKGEIFPMQLWQKIKVMRRVPQKKARDQRSWDESWLTTKASTEYRHTSRSVNNQESENS